MQSLLMIGMLAASLASGDETVLESTWLYNGLNRPVMVHVHPPRYGQITALVLLDAEGGFLAKPVEVAPGEVDLGEQLAEIWQLRRTGYLQMLADGEAVSSALVVEPMLSRLVPVTEEAVAPSGMVYTRIVGWYDEHHPPAAGREESGEDAKESTPASEEVGEGPERLFTGVRVYPERDVLLHTSLGDMRIAMRPDHAPNTVWNFLRLCEGGFYRGVAFHRIVPMTRDGDPFVIQAGDPTVSGSGGPGYWLPMERSELPHDFGVISMARDMDPDSAGSQFFICLSREGTARLDGDYCAFGYVVEGRDTILRIADVELADIASGRPAVPPVIESVELVSAPARRPGAGRGDRRVMRREPNPPAAEAETEAERIPR